MVRRRIIGCPEAPGHSLFVPAGRGPIDGASLPYAPAVIVVIGNPMLRASAPDGAPGGAAALAALSAAQLGAEVQLVGKTGDDARGDTLLLALGRARVGHVAILRDAAHATPVITRRELDDAAAATIATDEELPSIDPPDPAARPTLEAADVHLALRYLPDYRVVVVAEPQPDDVIASIAEAATYAGAALLMLVSPGWRGTAPAGALVVEADTADPESPIAALLGAAAARVDAGMPLADAMREVAAQG